MIVYVSLGNGVVVPHTREEFERLMRGVDMQAAKAAVAKL